MKKPTDEQRATLARLMQEAGSRSELERWVNSLPAIRKRGRRQSLRWDAHWSLILRAEELMSEDPKLRFRPALRRVVRAEFERCGGLEKFIATWGGGAMATKTQAIINVIDKLVAQAFKSKIGPDYRRIDEGR